MPIRLCVGVIVGFVISGKKVRRIAHLEQQHGHILKVSRECG